MTAPLDPAPASVGRTLPERLAAVATAVAASIVVVALAVVPFLTPAWIGFEQGRTGAAALTGYSEPDLRTATNAILHDLVLGPPEFAVQVAGAPVLAERERGHMRDVRGVFAAFGLLAAVAAVLLVALVAGARRLGHPERAWSAVSTGMRWLIVAIVLAGAVSAIAFDTLFEVFHRLFFPGGTYTFDPRTDHLVQLFPFAFWMETTIALGVVIVAAATLISVVARRRARAFGHVHSGENAPSSPSPAPSGAAAPAAIRREGAG